MFHILTLIIDKYNLVHILTILFFPLLAVASYFIFRKKSEKTKVIYLWILMSIIFLATWITFIISYVQDYNKERIFGLDSHCICVQLMLPYIHYFLV